MSLFSSINPATGDAVWTGEAATPDDVAAAVRVTRRMFTRWSCRPLAERTEILHAFARELGNRTNELAAAISREVGKPRWEALTEVRLMITKIDFAIAAHAQRCGDFRGGPAVTRFRPHGVVAVFGPFNFPGHLPNGHIVPALLAGNTVVFKPSEHAPLVAALTIECWRAAGLPPDALALVQGGRETGAALARHPGIDGVLFTGSNRTGCWLNETLGRTPEKILALEMGGNNPLAVWDAPDASAAAWIIAQSAFLTAGQRCTCARRLILPAGAAGETFLAELLALIGRLRVGAWTNRPEPFLGPVISAAAARKLVEVQAGLAQRGGRVLRPLHHLHDHTGLVAPGVVDVTAVSDRADEEIFGPLLQVIRVPDFAAAMAEANRTRYGLAAGLITGDRRLYERFRTEVRTGIVNWNQPLTGASGAAPFGGVGASGNHRPSGFFAADYCSYPVASLEAPEIKLPAEPPPGLDP